MFTIFVIETNFLAMGYPLSTFQQLSGLCSNEPFIRKTFNEYKLVSVIVHAPEDDRFRREIKYSFEHLHEVTGKDFAFISFINPPYKWAASHSGWMGMRESLSNGRGLDDSGFVRALQRRLDLPDNPCLVLTDDLLSNKYVILPTSRDNVISQMEAISGFVNSWLGRFPVDEPEFLNFLSRLGSAFSEQTTDGNSLAKNIADLTAVRALTGAGAIWDNRFARETQIEDAYRYVRSELKSLWVLLGNSRESGDSDKASEMLEKFSDYLSEVIRVAEGNNNSHYSHGHNLNHRTDSADIFADEELGLGIHTAIQKDEKYLLRVQDDEGLESITRDYLSNFNMLLPVYFNSFHDHFKAVELESLSPKGFEKDFSPLGNYLGKAMEEEMNASLVQRVRQLMGVDMPKYYRRYEETLKDPCAVKTRDKIIYLNKRGRNLSDSDYSDWSYSMGEVLCVLREMAKSKPSKMGIFCDEAFIEKADSFARNRNTACHSGIFAITSFDDMYEGFWNLKRFYLPEMIRLKKSLRGGADESISLFDLL